MFHVLPHSNTAGCKIKALRAKTNTYIKTPVRGEDPIFIITGRPEDVSVAKKEILHAADHFSQIRASRRSSSVSPPNVGSTINNGGVSTNGSNLSSTEEKVTIFVRVPYRVVGLVVGPKGATVKRIQQSTGTYIVTPSRDMEPYFEVRGSPENVEQARKEIESYIVLRTGGAADQIGSPSGLVHCTESIGGGERGVNGTAKRIVRRTMSVSETPNLLVPNSITSTTTVSENIGRKVEHRTSPLSSAVFSSGSNSQPTYEDNDILHPIPMSAPAMAFNKVFDFGSNKLQHYTAAATTTPTPTTTNWNGSWSPQPTTPTPLTNGWWGTLSYNSKASPQPPSPTGSWGSSGGKLSPQPPSPTGSWGSNSSEGLAVTSPRPFPSNGLSSRQGGYSQFPRASSMQQLRKMNHQNGFTPIIPAAVCCCCEQNEADTILVPCGHKITCFDCACRMSTYSAICPHCNSKIDSLAQQLSA